MEDAMEQEHENKKRGVVRAEQEVRKKPGSKQAGVTTSQVSGAGSFERLVGKKKEI